MTVEIQTVQGVAVVVLKGDVDLQSSPKVRKALLQCLSDKRDVLVDMAAVSYIDSSGIASLVEAFQGARKAGTRFGLVGVSPSAMRVLQLARLDRVFAIHASVEDAVKGA
jgi:anti-sigma B factor antagonist